MAFFVYLGSLAHNLLDISSKQPALNSTAALVTIVLSGIMITLVAALTGVPHAYDFPLSSAHGIGRASCLLILHTDVHRAFVFSHLSPRSRCLQVCMQRRQWRSGYGSNLIGSRM